jgi:cell wall-associated NlpC family hydrolase
MIVFAVPPTGAAPAAPPASSASGARSSDSSAPTPSDSPSDAAAAERAAQKAAAEVAAAKARIAQQQSLVEALSLAAEQAEAQYHVQLGLQRRAQAAADRAAAQARSAAAAFALAGRRLGALVALQYEIGGAAADAGQLLSSPDPSELLETAGIQQQLGRYQSAVVEVTQAARDASDRANVARHQALAAVQTVTLRIKRLRDLAAKNYADASLALVTLRADLAKAQTSKKDADAVLSLFLGGWSMADPAAASALNKQYLALAAEMRNAAMAPAATHWTAAMGQSVVYRTLQMIGTPYAWAGGGLAGPSQGVCVSGDAAGDCHVVGFDCSGLTMYGWAPYLALPHYAASQYAYGSFHPSPTQLAPGDLVFWSSDGKVSGIHHVAMYVGDGNVIQAPNSGDIVRITPLGNVASGYFGATRPLS